MDLVRICEDMICLNYQTKRVVVFVECGSSYTYIYIRTHKHLECSWFAVSSSVGIFGPEDLARSISEFDLTSMLSIQIVYCFS